MAADSIFPKPRYVRCMAGEPLNLLGAHILTDPTLSQDERLAIGPAVSALKPFAREVAVLKGFAAPLPWPCVLIGKSAGHRELAHAYSIACQRRPEFTQSASLPYWFPANEGYVLRSAPGLVALVAKIAPGFFHGARSLAQALDDSFLPRMLVVDWPSLPVRGLHLRVHKPAQVAGLIRLVGEKLPASKANTLIVELNYHFKFRSHPKVSERDAIAAEDLRALAAACRRNSVRLIPLLNCLGHQSWGTRRINGLLRAHPEFAENQTGPIKYCHSWCASNPKVYRIVFDLLDELVDAAGADAIHVGMDEVFELGRCPRCRGYTPDVLFARAVNKLYSHVAGRRKLKMLMWGDRLIDGTRTPYNEMNGARNGTAEAVYAIPRDILLCDWHYHLHRSYPSVQMFRDAGFDFVSCSWWKTAPVKAFIRYAIHHGGSSYRGHIATNWHKSSRVISTLLRGGPLQTWPESIRLESARRSFLTGMELSWRGM